MRKNTICGCLLIALLPLQIFSFVSTVAAQTQTPSIREPKKIEKLFVGWMSPEVRLIAQDGGWKPIPLMTHPFHFDVKNDRFDPKKYRDNIWHPEVCPWDLVEYSCKPVLGKLNWEKLGIPYDDRPEYYQGWADLDLERYDPIRHPERYRRDEVMRIKQSYIELATITKQLRPNTKIILHGLINVRGSKKGESIISEIASHYDAISPAIYPRFVYKFANMYQQLALIDRRLEFSAELRNKLGVGLYPIIWNRFYPVGILGGNPSKDKYGRVWRPVMPPNIARKVLKAVAKYNPDGIIVYGKDGWNFYRLAPNWPPDTPDGPSVNRAMLEWLRLIEEVFEDPDQS